MCFREQMKKSCWGEGCLQQQQGRAPCLVGVSLHLPSDIGDPVRVLCDASIAGDIMTRSNDTGGSTMKKKDPFATLFDQLAQRLSFENLSKYVCVSFVLADTQCYQGRDCTDYTQNAMAPRQS